MSPIATEHGDPCHNAYPIAQLGRRVSSLENRAATAESRLGSHGGRLAQLEENQANAAIVVDRLANVVASFRVEVDRLIPAVRAAEIAAAKLEGYLAAKAQPEEEVQRPSVVVNMPPPAPPQDAAPEVQISAGGWAAKARGEVAIWVLVLFVTVGAAALVARAVAPALVPAIPAP